MRVIIKGGGVECCDGFGLLMLLSMVAKQRVVAIDMIGLVSMIDQSNHYLDWDVAIMRAEMILISIGLG